MHHGSARLTVHGRLTLCRRVVEEGWTVAKASLAAGVSRQAGSKWVGRYRELGIDGLANRSTRPRRSPRRVRAGLQARIVKLRTKEHMGPHRISWALRIARSTVYAVLRRLGLHRLSRLEPRPGTRRYEWPEPGDLVHLDTKKLGRIGLGGGKRFGGPALRDRHRGIGWDVVHVAIDDHSRLAYAEELPDEGPATTAAFSERALSFFACHGISVRRILTDNGTPDRSGLFAGCLAAHGIVHKRTRPYTPRTNGKAEAMVGILLRGWAYRRPYRSTAERIAALGPFLMAYNYERPHGGLDGARPIDRVRQ